MVLCHIWSVCHRMWLTRLMSGGSATVLGVSATSEGVQSRAFDSVGRGRVSPTSRRFSAVLYAVPIGSKSWASSWIVKHEPDLTSIVYDGDGPSAADSILLGPGEDFPHVDCAHDLVIV